jgi:hypothetical protein
MTRDNLRKRGMPKPLECSLCKEIESVKHLLFECLISKLLWDMVFEVFGISVTDFLSIASKWICNTRHLQFNIISSAVIWSIWNNRNSIVFNKKSLVKYETSVALDIVISEKLEDPVQRQSMDESGSVCRFVDPKTQAAAGTEVRLICKSFNWITSWSSSAARAHHGGRASMAYLQNHPDDDAVHVVIG